MRLIGFAFGLPNEEETRLWGVPNEFRFCRLEATTKGYIWRKWELPQERADNMAEEILKLIKLKPDDFSGLTMFFRGKSLDRAGNEIEPGFELAIRMKGESGWSVKRLTFAEADMFFSHLRFDTSEPGPWHLTEGVASDIRDSYIIPELAFKALPPMPKPAPKPVPDPLADLMALIGASEAAVRAGTAALATLVAGRG